MQKIFLPIGDTCQQFDISEETRVMFITGAGLSVSSGLPTYYGENGVYSGYRDGPELVMNESNMKNHPERIWDVIMPMMQKSVNAAPNNGHIAIAKIQKLVKTENSMIYTQNVDGLHQQAGSTNVIEIHGNGRDVICRSCFYKGKKLDRDNIGKSLSAYKSFNWVLDSYKQGKCPVCPDCGGRLRPDIVPFGGDLDFSKIDTMRAFVEKGVDLMFCVGTRATFPYIQHPINRAYAKDAVVLNVNPQKLYLDYAYPVETGMGSDEFFEKLCHMSNI